MPLIKKQRMFIKVREPFEVMKRRVQPRRCEARAESRSRLAVTHTEFRAKEERGETSIRAEHEKEIWEAKG